jgi:hypothetical protein
MRIAWLSWSVLVAAWVPVFVACGNNSNNPLGDPGSSGDDATASSSSGSGSGGSSGSSSGSGSGGIFQMGADAGVMVADSACKAGEYTGTFTGSYSSHLILGIPLTVKGNVDLVLNQEGGDQQQCMVHGEFESCANVFTLSDGTITGVANPAMVGDASFGGYPYFCSMTGTLDCANKVLVDGWIECTYCAFDNLVDGGRACDGANVGGQFAGPLTADYDTDMLAFVNGDWNGAESLSDQMGNYYSGMGTLPDGGSLDDYLSLDGGYGFLGKFGGSGMWNAAKVP